MLNRTLVEKILLRALETGGDFAELFFEDTHEEALIIGDNKIKNAVSEIISGVGIRVMKDNFYTYVATNNLSENGLMKAAEQAAAALSEKRIISKIELITQPFENKHKMLLSPFALSKLEYADLLHKASQIAYQASDKIKWVDAAITESLRQIMVANSDGLWVEDTQLRNRFSIAPRAEDANEKFVSSFSMAKLKGGELYQELNLEENITQKVKEAVEMLKAENCPSGKIPVVIASADGALLFHEACGHSLEATSVAKKNSVLYGKKNQKVANEQVTIIDDGTIPNAWGSNNVDDEGVKTRSNTLIENGILKNYLVDKFHGRLMGEEANGCSRRESYLLPPTARMGNTKVANGNFNPEDIIAATSEGIYVVDFLGGSVNTSVGDFNFSVKRAFLIENGKITKPIKGAKLVGNSADILMNIDMVGNDLAMSQRAWTCGATSGLVPVGQGMPTVRITNITVGGQK